MTRLLQFLAVPMPVIKAYSFQHVVVAAATLAAAFCLAKLLHSKSRTAVLFSCGLILGFSEVIKQLLLTYVRGGVYSWSDFPFQLCSVPMYLCLVYPLWKRGRRAIENFLVTFGLMGSIAAFAVPYSSFTDYLVLTVQSVLWHGILFFLAMYVLFSEKSESRNPRRLMSRNFREFRQLFCDFSGAALLYLICALIAVFLNLVFYHISGGSANMFFFGPGWPDMIILNDIYKSAGWIPETLAMAAGTEVLAFVLYVCQRREG